MQIKNVVPKPYEKSISPAISFEVEIAHIKFQEAIVRVDGWLESDDGKILANVVGFTLEKSKSNEVGARDSGFDSKFKETVYNATLFAPLSRRAVDYIEKRRMKNEKRDVYLTLNLNVKSIVSKASISHLHTIEARRMGLPSEITTSSGRTRVEGIMAYAYDPKFSTRYANRWILSGNGSPVFLSLVEQSFRKEGVRIPSTDWIHDYVPKLELGEYFVVEIPKGKMVMKKAWEYIEKAEECSRQWDTKGVYAHCREAGDFLNGAIKKKFRNDPIVKKWKRVIEKFNKLTSLDLHEEQIIEEEPKGEIFIGRPETEHILVVTKALVKYAEELLQEKS